MPQIYNVFDYVIKRMQDTGLKRESTIRHDIGLDTGF